MRHRTSLKPPFHLVTDIFCESNTEKLLKIILHCVGTLSDDQILILAAQVPECLMTFYSQCCTWIFCKLDEASLRFWGTSKHLAVLILALTNHCWNSLKAERNPCSSSFSLLWHSLEAWRLRLGTNQEKKQTDFLKHVLQTITLEIILFYSTVSCLFDHGPLQHKSLQSDQKNRNLCTLQHNLIQSCVSERCWFSCMVTFVALCFSPYMWMWWTKNETCICKTI